jgi:Na+-translocating ferredoxin:NAD+ oxidoreductase RNF subunit RnfB
MDIMNLVKSTLALGSLGLIFGTGLAFASKKFAVEIDARVAQIREAVPGANCGACGYPGCDAFSAAIAKGEAPITGCPVGGQSLVDELTKIMGIEIAEAIEPEKARLKCHGENKNSPQLYRYNGIMDCSSVDMMPMGGPKACRYGCLGLGSCVRICPFNAIHISDEGIAVVNEEKCTGCGKCVDICPRNLYRLVGISHKVWVACMNNDKGKDVIKVCKVGCIGCQKCIKVCPYDAMLFDKNLATVDYEKCTNCMICVENCPTKAIYGDLDKRNLETIKSK